MTGGRHPVRKDEPSVERRGHRMTWRRIRRAAPAALVALAMASSPGHGAPARPSPAATHFAGLKTGRWIQLEGTLVARSTVTCTGLGQLAGDFLDDDWSLRGTVHALDMARREFSIAGCRVRITDNTIFDNPRGIFRGFSDLRAGKLVEVDGSFVQSRTLIADEVDDESEELVEEPELKDQVMVVGKIERLDPKKRTVTVMGIEFHITDKTRVRSVIE